MSFIHLYQVQNVEKEIGKLFCHLICRKVITFFIAFWFGFSVGDFLLQAWNISTGEKYWTRSGDWNWASLATLCQTGACYWAVAWLYTVKVLPWRASMESTSARSLGYCSHFRDLTWRFQAKYARLRRAVKWDGLKLYMIYRLSSDMALVIRWVEDCRLLQVIY